MFQWGKMFKIVSCGRRRPAGPQAFKAADRPRKWRRYVCTGLLTAALGLGLVVGTTAFQTDPRFGNTWFQIDDASGGCTVLVMTPSGGDHDTDFDAAFPIFVHAVAGAQASNGGLLGTVMGFVTANDNGDTQGNFKLFNLSLAMMFIGGGLGGPQSAMGTTQALQIGDRPPFVYLELTRVGEHTPPALPPRNIALATMVIGGLAAANGQDCGAFTFAAHNVQAGSILGTPTLLDVTSFIIANNTLELPVTVTNGWIKNIDNGGITYVGGENIAGGQWYCIEIPESNKLYGFIRGAVLNADYFIGLNGGSANVVVNSTAGLALYGQGPVVTGGGGSGPGSGGPEL